MLARCRRKLKKFFADESLSQLRKVFRKPRASGFQCSTRYGEPLDGACGTHGTLCAGSATTRASGFAIGTASNSHDSAPHYHHGLSGPVEHALQYGQGKRRKSCCFESSICRFRCERLSVICICEPVL